MGKTNYSVARVVTYTKQSIGKAERHNERKNTNYSNMNVDLEQTKNNVYKNDYHIGKYGHLRLQYLKEHKKAEYTIMLLDGTLRKHKFYNSKRIYKDWK